MGQIYSSSVIRQPRKYGWRRDKPDFRDLKRQIITFTHGDKNLVDLRKKCPNVYNQGNLGSCTANAIAGAYEFDMMKEEEKNIFIPSRLFIYYNERKMEGNIGVDSGAEIRDGIKSINSIGIVSEKEWPYDISKFTVEPPQKLYNESKTHRALKYERLKQHLHHLKQTLCDGYPFVFGFAVYESFESDKVAKTGIMRMPSKDEKLLGGHAVMAIGYDDDKKMFIIRNSWGEEWGDHGYFYMPYEYMLNEDLCSDFWVIEQVKDE